ncbi:MAG: hypothetical protein R3A48_01330 [Polyangiales bacterium]
MSAAFYVSQSTDPARPGSRASGYFWTGERRPSPGGGGLSHRLAAGESVSVNGVALSGEPADWGYLYQGELPAPSDGRWLFRFVIAGQTITRTLTLMPVNWVDFPVTPVSIGAGVVLRWAPALPESSTRRATLTSCVISEVTELETASVRFVGRVTASPCESHAQLSATVSEPLGFPFREGSTLSASTGLDSTLRVIP